jgi:hypothetical protein
MLFQGQLGARHYKFDIFAVDGIVAFFEPMLKIVFDRVSKNLFYTSDGCTKKNQSDLQFGTEIVSHVVCFLNILSLFTYILLPLF